MIENVYNLGGQETHLPNFPPHIVRLQRRPYNLLFLYLPQTASVIKQLIYLVKVLWGR